MDLTSRVVLIVGGARMGADLASAVADRGADVVLGYRQSRRAADAAASAVRQRGRRALVTVVDVTNPESVDALGPQIDRTFGRLDVAVQMASVYRAVPLDAIDAREWHAQIDVDLSGSFLIARAAIPLMRRTGGGRIVLFSDWLPASGRPRYREYLPYYVAKAGVKALAEALALELAPDNILVNAIAPGPILAPDATSDEERAKVVRATPLGRWGGVEAITQTVLSIVESDFLTGETIRVDGGRHLK